MRKGDYLDFFAQVPMFQALSKKDLAHVGRLAERLDIEDGRVLVKQGAPGHEFFIIEEGSAKVVRHNRKVATLGAGDFFGELALLDGAPRDATVTAESDMKVIVLGRREFLGLLDEVPGVSLKVMKGMAQRLREADSKPTS